MTLYVDVRISFWWTASCIELYFWPSFFSVSVAFVIHWVREWLQKLSITFLYFGGEFSLNPMGLHGLCMYSCTCFPHSGRLRHGLRWTSCARVLIYNYIHRCIPQARIHSYRYKLCVNFSELLLFSAEDNSSTAFRTKFLRSTRQVLPNRSWH